MPKTLISNIFVVLYLASTLWVRLVLEPQIKGNYLISVGIGLFALVFLWALIRSGFLKPTILGLHRFGPPPK